MRWVARCVVAFACCVSAGNIAFGQTFGVELHNNLMPASGGMGGVSIARPQDLTSGLNANPATLTQFRGTQFIFGNAWAEPTFNLTQTSQLPVMGPSLIDPYSAKSSAPGVPVGNIGITQDLTELGMPATFGIGFVTTAGGFFDFRHVPESRGTNTGQVIFNVPVAVGLDLTERLSVGASASLGIAFYDGPFVGVSGMTPDYAPRMTLGANYKLSNRTTVGGYFQTRQAFSFDNAFLLDPGPNQRALNINMDLPQNIGVGIANNSLMNGCLLLATDVVYKYWEEADLYDALYDNQLAIQTGAQLTRGKCRFRLGYTWAENPLTSTPGLNVGGIAPGPLPIVYYTQGLVAVTSQHRLSAGVGVTDVLPGIDLDLMAGGMFKDTQQLGQFTSTSIESYWLGLGLTWRFGRGACCGVCTPDSWNTCGCQ